MPISLTGVLPLDKPSGMTSHDVVALVRRALRQGGYGRVKVGHAGTLDPSATGVLLVCVGGATRLADLLADQGKRYHAEFTLGAQTTTEDADGGVTQERDASHVTQADVEDALANLTGTLLQVPPMVSAVHHQGHRLYELARAGITVERAARAVEIKSIELLRYSAGAARPVGEMVVACGKGTYIRTLCADLGASLGVGGHMSALRRLSVGVFMLEACSSLEPHAISAESLIAALVSPADAAAFLPLRLLSAAELIDIQHGRAIPIGQIDGEPVESGWVRLTDASGDMVALALCDAESRRLLPKKVLMAEG